MVESSHLHEFDPEEFRRDQHLNGVVDIGDRHLQTLPWEVPVKDVTRCPEWVEAEKRRMERLVHTNGEVPRPLRARVITPEMSSFYRLQATPGFDNFHNARRLLDTPNVRDNLTPSELRHAQNNIGLTDLASRTGVLRG